MYCHDCVELNLANDGGELIDPSGVNDLFECEEGNYVLSSDWVGAYTRPWRNTPVRRGMFRRVDYGLVQRTRADRDRTVRDPAPAGGHDSTAR